MAHIKALIFKALTPLRRQPFILMSKNQRQTARKTLHTDVAAMPHILNLDGSDGR
jgi:hypothetical protein